jgi:peptide/nickel transport system substrate-binding protein
LSTPFLTAARQRGLITRYADRFHATDSPGTHFLFLNTRVPPFNDVRARRAVNYAVDRAKLAQLAGGLTRMRPTCQILPPSIPGYRPYCPYTAHPSRAGTWSAPDLAKARTLVAASETTGDRVTVMVPKAALASALGRYFTGLLRQLGYDAKLREAAWPIHVSLMADSRNRIQAGTIGWFADKLTPSNFVQPLFTCAAFVPKSPRNSNLSEYCNPRLDAAARAAVAAQTSDPVRAATLWAAIDRTLVDQAVGVPWANQRDSALVSARVGNYQTHPLWGTLLDQLWVKSS